MKLDEQNEHIILALRKLGIYMARNEELDALPSAAEKNVYLQKALDAAVETCCICPLLFEKRELAPGKLVLSKKPQWTGWTVDHALQLRSRILELKKRPETAKLAALQAMVEIHGDHALWAPFRMGRYSVTASAKFQGSSMRIAKDVPELETLIMRILILTSKLDGFGARSAGLMWALTHIPANNNGDNAHMPAPPQAAAIMAIQAIDVLQIDLSDDIDKPEDETGEPEMKSFGYVGNKNRRAVPVIVCRYATTYAGLDVPPGVQELVRYARIPRMDDPANAYLTAIQHNLLSRMLESNSRRLSKAEKKRYQAAVPPALRAVTAISFISPIYCPASSAADAIELGRRPRLACSVCLKTESETKLFFCTGCSGSAYCSSEHQSEDWARHKPECRSTKNVDRDGVPWKSPRAVRIDALDLRSPFAKVFLQLQYYRREPDAGNLCAWTNPVDRLKPYSKSSANSRCAKTIFGPDERFMVRVRWGGFADVTEDQRRRGTWDNQRGMNFMVMAVLQIVDRQHSCSVFFQRQTGTVVSKPSGPTSLTKKSEYLASQSLILPGLPNPGSSNEPIDQDNSTVFDAIVEAVRKWSVDQCECVFLWAVRRGDCLEIDLVDVPDQKLGW
ncbi:hypothetical protein C8R43DRAFT_1237197 [Mycena crocata]|nr:hypothetical protein C8R43DRAFT_1237197 [Mycena crocata]